MSSALSAHAGARLVSLDVVKAIPAPAPTATWCPISHGQMLDWVASILSDFGYSTKGEGKYALSNDNARMFGVLDIEGHTDENNTLGFAIGIRGSFNKTLAAAICFGNHVFVCDNMAFAGTISLSRRHTPGIIGDFPQMIQSAIGNFIAFRDMQLKLFANLRKAQITREQAWGICGAIYEAGGTTKAQVADIVELTFDNEQHIAMHGTATAWSLYNAYTGNHKDRQNRNMILAADESVAMHQVFKARFGDNGATNVVISRPSPTAPAPAPVVQPTTEVVEVAPVAAPAAEQPAVVAEVVDMATGVVEATTVAEVQTVPAADAPITTDVAPIPTDDAPF